MLMQNHEQATRHDRLLEKGPIVRGDGDSLQRAIVVSQQPDRLPLRVRAPAKGTRSSSILRR